MLLFMYSTLRHGRKWKLYCRGTWEVDEAFPWRKNRNIFYYFYFVTSDIDRKTLDDCLMCSRVYLVFFLFSFLYICKHFGMLSSLLLLLTQRHFEPKGVVKQNIFTNSGRRFLFDIIKYLGKENVQNTFFMLNFFRS